MKSGIAVGGPADGRLYHILHGKKMMIPFVGKTGIEWANYRWSDDGEWVYVPEDNKSDATS